MKIYFLMSIFLLAGGSGSLTAQTVSGKVVNTEQQPIDGATIILQTSDSTFVDATISNADGNFVFNHQPEAYRLIFQLKDESISFRLMIEYKVSVGIRDCCIHES